MMKICDNCGETGESLGWYGSLKNKSEYIKTAQHPDLCLECWMKYSTLLNDLTKRHQLEIYKLIMNWKKYKLKAERLAQGANDEKN